MKKQLLLGALAVLAGTSAYAAGNVYASQLSCEGTTVSMVLNQPATAVIVDLLDANGAVVASYDCGAGVAGVNTFDIAAATAPEGQYNWQVTVKGEAYTEPVLISADKPANLNISNIRGLGIDFSQKSKYFGRIYAASTAAATPRPGERAEGGVYILNADFSALSEHAYTGGQAWSGNSSPNNVKVAENGQAFVCDWTDGHAGIWVIDPADPAADFTPVFAGERDDNGLITTDGVKVSGSIQDFAIYGDGESRMLYTDDEDINANNGEIFVYNIGNLATPWTAAPTACWGDNNGKIVNANHRVHSDQRGGLWVSQYRWEEGETLPVLSHCNAQGVWDFNTGDKSIVIGSGPAGAMAVNADGSLIAVADNGHGTNIKIVKAEYDAEGVPTIALLYTIDVTTYGNRPMGLAFDAANNVYCAFNNDGEDGGIGAWGVPSEENAYTTAALVPMAFTTAIGNVAVEAAAAAEYFDMMGRRVAEPQAGKLYIKRCGANATKVVL